MISIQELGLSIMSDSPMHFYVLGGSEYGIKDRYLDTLTKFYGRKEEYPSVSAIVDFLSVKHLIPVPPAVYVVRYDESFVSSISAALVQKINSLKIQGTIFCVYTEPKHIAKIDKFLPNCTCVIEPVNSKYIERYLHSDFPKLDDRSIKIATKCAVSYGHARTICRSMNHANPETLAKMSEEQLSTLFGCSNSSSGADIQKAIASRNFVAACKLLDSYEGNLDTLVYTILQTMIELEKVLTSKYASSDLRDYAKLWKIEDVYHMFMHGYNELDKLRSNTSTDIKSSLIYLFGLFTFKDVPSLEVMNAS